MITRHTKLVGVIAALLLVGVLVVLSVLFYMVSSAKEDFALRQHEVAEAHAHERELASLARLVEKSVEERGLLASYILSEEDTIDFLGLLETLAREQGVPIEIESLDVQEIDETFEKLRVNVAIEGTYESVLHMLTLFETLPYQSYVGSVNISRSSDSAQNWNGVFVLYVVKYKEEGS